MKAFKELKMPIGNAEDAFVMQGFHSWKLTTSLPSFLHVYIHTRNLQMLKEVANYFTCGLCSYPS